MIQQNQLATANRDTRFPPQDSSHSKTALAVHIDYLTFYARGRALEEMNQCIEFVRGDIPVDFSAVRGASFPLFPTSNSFFSLDKCISGGFSVYAEDDPNAPNYGVELCDYFVRLSGKYWEGVNTRKLWRIFRGLHHAYQVTATRADVAADDPTCQLIKVEDFQLAAELENYKYVASHDIYTSKRRGFDPRTTVYLGSRQSDKFYRIYKHDKVNRLELELKGGQSRNLFEYISTLENSENDETEVESSIVEFLASLIAGGVDMVDRHINSAKGKDKKHAERCPRLDFWQRIIDALAEPLRIVIAVDRHHNLEKTLRWIDKQVIGSLLCLKRAYEGKVGISWRGILEAAMEQFVKADRWSSRHQLMLDTFIGERNWEGVQSA